MNRRAAFRGSLLVTVTVTLAAVALIASWPGPPSRCAWFWVAACFAGELLWVRLPLGRATLSMASACNFAAMLVLPRGEAMVAIAAAGLAAEAVVLRKPPARFLFNAAQSTLAIGAAALVYSVLHGPRIGPAPASLLAGLRPLTAAALVYTLINYGAVSLAVAIAEGISPWRTCRANFCSFYELLSSATLFSLGVLLAFVYGVAGPLGTLIVSLPLLLAHESYRRYVALGEERLSGDRRAAA